MSDHDTPDWTAAIAECRIWLTEGDDADVNVARCLLAAHEERERLTGEVARLTEALDAPLDSAEAFEARIRADERSRAERDIAAAIERMSARRGDRTGSLYLAGVWVLASDYPKARPAAPSPTECPHLNRDDQVCTECGHGSGMTSEEFRAAAPSSEPAPDIDEKVEQRVFLRCVAAHGHDGPHLYASTDHPSARGGIGEPRCVTYSRHQENFDRECRPIPTNPEHEAAIDALVADRLAGRAVTRMAPAEPEVVWTDEGEATAFGIPLAYNRTTDDFGTDVPMTVHEVFIGGDEQDGASICASTEATAKRLAVAVAREMQRG